MLTGRLAYRAAALAVSAVAHVLVYGALSLAPAWPLPPRVLLITELIVTEAPVTPAPRPVTPPRPLVRPKPPKTPVETAPVPSAAKVEPPVEQNVPEPPIVTPPPKMAAAASTRDAIEAPPASAPAAPMPGPVASMIPPARDAAPPAASSSVTTFSDGGAAAVAALPPGPPAAPSGALSRTAIPRGGYQVTPSYPATARRLGIQGTALLRVFVDADGRVGDIVIKQSAGHPDLDRAAADAVRRWRFEPARRGTETVAMWVELPFEFHLR